MVKGLLVDTEMGPFGQQDFDNNGRFESPDRGLTKRAKGKKETKRGNKERDQGERGNRPLDPTQHQATLCRMSTPTYAVELFQQAVSRRMTVPYTR